jgi:hypothetical protein
LWTRPDHVGLLFGIFLYDRNTEQIGGAEPPPRFSVRRRVAVRECLMRSTVPVCGGRSPLALGIIERTVKLTLPFLVAGLLLTACKHTDTVRPHLTRAELQQEAALPRPSDSEIRQKIIGTWMPDPRTDSDEYQSMTIRPNGSFTTVISRKLVREGTWDVQSGMMRLTTTNGVPTQNGFRYHSISYVDDHNLVCGIDISVAGRMRFTK